MASAIAILWFIVIMIRTLGVYLAWNAVLSELLPISDIAFGDALLLALCIGMINASISLNTKSKEDGNVAR